MAFIQAFLLIASLQARVLIKSIRFGVCLLLALIPALIAVAAGGASDAEELASQLSVMLLQFAAPLVGLILGSVVIAEEVEGRTITYFFTRPVHRSALFLGRWAAVALVGASLMALSSAVISVGSTHDTFQDAKPQVQWTLEQKGIIGWKELQTGTRRSVRFKDEQGQFHRKWVGNLELEGVIDLPPGRKGRAQRVRGSALVPKSMTLPDGFTQALILAACLGAVFYTMITAGLSIYFKRPMIIGLAYAFAVEGVLANLPGSTQALSVQHHLRSLLVDMEQSHWRKIFPDGEFFTPTEAVLRLSIFGLLVLGICSWAVARKQFVLTS